MYFYNKFDGMQTGNNVFRNMVARDEIQNPGHL